MLRTLLVISFIAFFSTGTIAADYVDPTTGMEFVKIPAGTFSMGDPSGEDTYASPTREVNIRDFFIGKHEVTFSQYDKFCQETNHECPDDEGWGRGKQPIINVTWDEAVAFTDWLSQKSGKTYRLPSEAEWEYAARGGTTTIFWWGDKLIRDMANCIGCGSQWDNKQPAPVGSFKANPYGLYDMTGNVYEWCYDTKHVNYQDAPTDGSAWTEEDDKGYRIARGGAWDYKAKELYSHARCWDNSDQRHEDTGFRIVLEP